jgi:hypothetical protein
MAHNKPNRKSARLKNGPDWLTGLFLSDEDDPATDE